MNEFSVRGCGVTESTHVQRGVELGSDVGSSTLDGVAKATEGADLGLRKGDRVVLGIIICYKCFACRRCLTKVKLTFIFVVKVSRLGLRVE